MKDDIVPQQPNPPVIESRSRYWDAWKGYSILAVIGIHAFGPCLKFPLNTFTFHVGFLSEQILDFAVGVFLAVSGYFSGCRDAMDFPAVFSYLRKRFLRLKPPYLTWTAIFILILHPRDFLSLRALFKDVFTGMGIGIGYFVIVLAQFILMAPLLARIRRDVTHISTMAGITVFPICCFIITAYATRNTPSRNFPYTPCFFPFGIRITILGCGCDKSNPLDRIFWSANPGLF